MLSDIINEKSVIPALKILYLVTARLMKILIFAVIHLFLLVIVLFLFWFFEISSQEVRTLLSDFFQGSLWLILSILGVSLTSIALLYWKTWKWLSTKISSKFVWMRNLSITLGHPATEFSVLFPRSQGPASAY